MDLDSARGLKASLLEELAEPLHLRPRGISAFGLAAGRIDELDSTQPTVALGVGPVSGSRFQLAVRVQHRGIEEAVRLEAIKEQARGEVDVRYIGLVVKYSPPWFRQRQRPITIGSSVGHYAITAGTVGCFVEVEGKGARLLSNNHVLADEGRGQQGDEILQPGVIDGGQLGQDTVGALDTFVRFGPTNRVDCAVAEVSESVPFDQAALTGVGSLEGVAAPEEVDLVQKLGRTTGHTRGRVTAFELDNVVVRFQTGQMRFDDQLEIQPTDPTPFSRGGDSGSLIVSADKRQAVGLLFAGTDHGGPLDAGLTYANPIGTVLETLGARVLS